MKVCGARWTAPTPPSRERAQAEFQKMYLYLIVVITPRVMSRSQRTRLLLEPPPSGGQAYKHKRRLSRDSSKDTPPCGAIALRAMATIKSPQSPPASLPQLRHS